MLAWKATRVTIEIEVSGYVKKLIEDFAKARGTSQKAYASEEFEKHTLACSKESPSGRQFRQWFSTKENPLSCVKCNEKVLDEWMIKIAGVGYACLDCHYKSIRPATWVHLSQKIIEKQHMIKACDDDFERIAKADAIAHGKEDGDEVRKRIADLLEVQRRMIDAAGTSEERDRELEYRRRLDAALEFAADRDMYYRRLPVNDILKDIERRKKAEKKESQIV